jgi:signal transduction histidine kinase
VPDDHQRDIEAVQNIAAVPTILDVVCRATGMGFAAVARVTEDRWIACQVLDNIHFGLPAGGELKVETTLCHEVREHRQVIVIDNVAEDPTYCAHHTPHMYGLQSYISVPIVLPDGRFFGTLCAIDPKPAKLNNPLILGTFKLFAELIAYHLDSADKVSAAEARFLEERTVSDTREQFIAVLGHDLRNPLAAVGAGVRMLLRDGWTDNSPRILQLAQSSIARMNGLVDNVMDLARARLGGGIILNIEDDKPLEPTLRQVIDEMRASSPERSFDVRMSIEEPVRADHQRLAQMFSNLLGNALAHGAEDSPIRIDAAGAGGGLELSVANAGEPISPEMMPNLFKPFYRGDVRQNQQGLGLGLFIASQIAEAHGGRIEVSSNDTETRFTFRIPTP